VILDLHEFAIGDRLGQAEYGAVIDPWMAGDNSVGFAGLQKDGGEGLHWFVNRVKSILQAGGRRKRWKERQRAAAFQNLADHLARPLRPFSLRALAQEVGFLDAAPWELD
jgi:hypothetical protein